MNSEVFDNFDNEQDRAVAWRLGRLRTMPVETARLDRLLANEIPQPAKRNRLGVMQWIRPLQAMAASLLVVGLIGALIWSTAGGPETASAAEMAQLHREMVNAPDDGFKVDSIEQASEMLGGHWHAGSGRPKVSDSHDMACCMTSVKDRKVASVLFRNDGRPVTLSVAKSSDLRSPQSTTVTREGRAYHVESPGGLNMVSTQRDGRWICVIGELPADRLIEIADGLRF